MELYANIMLGWSPMLALVPDGTRQVQQVVGWTGGFGTAPAVGLYIGSNGYVTNITDGVNVKGSGGGGGGGVALGQGVNTISSGTAVFSNSNGVSFGFNGNTITASVNTNYQSQGAYLTTAMQSNAGSNFMSTSQSSLFQQTSLMSNYQSTGPYLTTAMQSNAGSNFLSTSQSSLFQQTSLMSNYQPTGNYLTTAMQSNAGSNFIGTNSALTANGVSVTANSSGLSLNFPAFLTTAQPVGAYLTTAMASNAGSNFVNTSQSSVFQQTSQMSNYQSTGAYLTTAMQSNASSNFAGTGVSATNASVTLNTAGIQISVAAPGGGGGGAAISAAGNSQSTGTVSFANSGGVSFGLSNNGVMTATVATNYQSQGAYLTTAMQSNAGSNFLGTNSALTANGVSVTANSSGLSLNFPAFLTTAQPVGAYLTTAMASNASTNFAGLGTTFNGANISGSMTVNTAGINLSMSVAAPGGGAAINVSAGSTSNNLQTIVFSNSNGFSFGLNGSTVTGSWQESPKSFFAFPIGGVMTSNTSTLGASSVFVQPFILPYDVSASYIRMPASFAYGSTTAATTANTTLGISQTQTIWVNIYSNGTGANSKSLQYITQGSLVMVQQVNASVGAASNNQTVGHTISYGATGNTSSFSTTYNVNAASIQISTTHLTSFNALRWLDIPLPISLSGGAYWMGIQRSSASATAGSNIMTNVTSNMSQYIVTQVNTNWAVMGGASNNSTDGINIGQGLWSTNSSGATSSSMGFTNIVTQASHPLMPFQFIRQS